MESLIHTGIKVNGPRVSTENPSMRSVYILSKNRNKVSQYQLYLEQEREIKFIGLFENRGHRGPYSPYKPFNHNLNIGIIIFPHIDNPQYTGYE